MIERLELHGYRRIGVAVSGGADSVFLLHALHELGAAASVLHVNYGLRGTESEGDEEFVRTLALRCELPFHVVRCPPLTGNIEQEARLARYEFFTRQLAAGVCDAVATGHTLDDQAETVLYRFLRGAGTAGLSGIRPATASGVIRPLLDFRRDQIRNWLTDRGIEWREDRSNRNLDFLRNRIRLQHMPELSASLNPSLPEVLASTATWAQAEEDYWSSELQRLDPLYFIKNNETLLISAGPFLALPVAVQRRLLRRAIHLVRGSLRGIDFHHVERIRAMMATREGSGRVQLPDLDIYRSFDWLRLAPVGIDSRLERDFTAALNIPGRTEVKDRQLTIEMELVIAPDVYNSDVQGLDWERCTGSLSSQGLSSKSLILRNWRPGDQYQPQGRSAAEKIKTLFQEYRVPLWERRTWPVVVQVERTLGVEVERAPGTEQVNSFEANNVQVDAIVWSRGFGVATQFAAGPGARKVLKIREVMESKAQAAASISLKRARDNQFRHSGEPGAEVL